MPVNKNAMTRYKILDELLSNQYHDYCIDDMTEEVNNRLGEMGIDPVSRRCIEGDIRYIEFDGPFLANIKRYSMPSFDYHKQRPTTKRCLKYEDPSFSIFSKPLSDEETYLLKEALSVLGKFEGIPNMDSLRGLSLGLGAKDNQRKIVSFTRNPLEQSTTFGELFSAISQRQVIELHYHTFAKPDKIMNINIYPYLLKEYNRRWFLLSAAEKDNKILTFALDRINEVIPLPSHKYVDYNGDLDEWFDDIIGVTLYAECPIEHILFWVNNGSKYYVSTKPLHDSQIEYKNEHENALHEKYPDLKEGRFFSIECRYNYELISELSAYGRDLLVLSPKKIQDAVYERINNMLKDYQKLRT